MAAEYLLDVLGDKPVLALPTHRRDATAAADDAKSLPGRGAAGPVGAGGMASRLDSVNPSGVDPVVVPISKLIRTSLSPGLWAMCNWQSRADVVNSFSSGMDPAVLCLAATAVLQKYASCWCCYCGSVCLRSGAVHLDSHEGCKATMCWIRMRVMLPHLGSDEPKFHPRPKSHPDPTPIPKI